MLVCPGQRRCWQLRQRLKRSASSARQRLRLLKRWGRRRPRRWGWKLRPTSSTERLPKPLWSWRLCPRSAQVLAAVTPGPRASCEQHRPSSLGLSQQTPVCVCVCSDCWQGGCTVVPNQRDRHFERGRKSRHWRGEPPTSWTPSVDQCAHRSGSDQGESVAVLHQLSLSALSQPPAESPPLTPPHRCLYCRRWSAKPPYDDSGHNLHTLNPSTCICLKHDGCSFHFSLLANFLCPGTLDGNRVCLFLIFFKHFQFF